mmetsp:Transcript_34886/g.84292  ORF Transcript_34886/g.84292 Transcript_34886/m.84292 type:complete len:317 (+) Transcript_34886:263-1213(+)
MVSCTCMGCISKLLEATVTPTVIPAVVPAISKTTAATPEARLHARRIPSLHVFPNEPPNSRIHRLQFLQALRRNFNRVSFVRQNSDVVPWLPLTRVIDPVGLSVLALQDDARSSEVELLDLDRNFVSRVCLLHGNIVIALPVKHIHHPGLCHNSTNHDVLPLPLHPNFGSFHIFGIILDEMRTLVEGQLHARGDVTPDDHRPGNAANNVRAELGIRDLVAVHREDDVAEVHPAVVGRGLLGDVGHDGAAAEGIDDVRGHLVEERFLEITGRVEHGAEAAGVNAGLVVLALGGQVVGIECDWRLILLCDGTIAVVDV